MKKWHIFVKADAPIEPVKQGFSWPAFFFGGGWALVKGLWISAFVMIFLTMFLNKIGNQAQGVEAGWTIVGVFNGLLLIFGFMGNSWVRANLERRGYSHKGLVEAESLKGARERYREQLVAAGSAPPIEEKPRDRTQIRWIFAAVVALCFVGLVWWNASSFLGGSDRRVEAADTKAGSNQSVPAKDVATETVSPHIGPLTGKEAVDRYREGAERGDATAQQYLGIMYHKGQGVPQDYAEAVKWYREAAEQGYAPAQASLGLMYVAGDGVTQDYVQAHKWFNLASVNFSTSETKGRVKAASSRDYISAKMTSDQIAEAQKLAREWKPNAE